MSQVAKLFDGTPIPSVETLTGDIGGAVPPTANNINILTGDGLTTTGTPGTSTITITLDGLVYGTGQTIGAVTADLITISLGAIPTTYILEAKVVGFNAATPAGCAYNLICGVRTTGLAASLVNVQDKYNAEEASLIGCDANFVVAGNTVIVRVTGTAGLIVNWKATATQMGV